MTKYYVDYDSLKSFFQLIKACDYGGLLAFSTNEEIEASQYTIDIIESRIEELKMPMEDIYGK